MSFSKIFGGAKIIPVATFNDPEHAVRIARKLAAEGMPAVEVTLRTQRGLDCIRAIASALPDVIVGAGTVLTPRQMDDAAKAGARFLVSPGSTRELLEAATSGRHVWLPGVATPSEAMRMRRAGFDHLKFFPAGPSGGIAFLKAIAPVLPDVRFCPTGGVDQTNAESYLALPNVFAVGGSWVVPSNAPATPVYW
jgi:2-dehydro-3-deoxyphosphogluconate aldolase / (4S)-4-hydroxy-2-oxoglutarate aldolase